MKLIVAVDNNWGIGKDGDLLLSIPDDMRFFREKTRRAVLVMGYNTLLSFPGSKPLPNRMNIVLFNEPDASAPGTLFCGGLDQLFDIIRDMNSNDIYVIGGGSVYRQLLPYCDTAYITKMCFDGAADTFIPDLDALPGWSIAEESEIKEHEGIEYSFVEYRNKSPEMIGFSGRNTDMPAYFTKKPELSFDYPADADDKYRAQLSAALRAYFRPLERGVSAAGLSACGDSLEGFLVSEGHIARAGDILSLADRFGGSRYRIKAAKEQLSELLSDIAKNSADIAVKYV